jgi:hypothetical protein
VLTKYRIFLEQAHYSASTINLQLTAIRRLACEAADCGLLSPELAAGIRGVVARNQIIGAEFARTSTLPDASACLVPSRAPLITRTRNLPESGKERILEC